MVATAGWRVLGASATGKSHIASDLECQDAHAWFVGQDGVCCIAVADGAGSRTRSAEGSAKAVAAAVHFVRDALQQGQMAALTTQTIFAAARRHLDEYAAETGVPVREFATTLAVAVITENTVLLGQVGDSIVVTQGASGEIELASPAEKFEYVNESAFLSEEAWADHLRSDKFDAREIDGLALSTDGLRFKILDDLATSRPFEPFFIDLFSYVATPAATNESIGRFIDRIDDQSGDDKTLVAARKAPSSLSSEPIVVVNEFFPAPADPTEKPSTGGCEVSVESRPRHARPESV